MLFYIPREKVHIWNISGFKGSLVALSHAISYLDNMFILRHISWFKCYPGTSQCCFRCLWKIVISEFKGSSVALSRTIFFFLEISAA